jgi:ribose 5-phosphate isomerase A
MNQDELKQAVARAAIDHLVDGTVVGVGSGSTVALFIRELGQIRNRFTGAVSSSELSTRLLREEGIDVLPLEAVGSIPVYVDGADEIDPKGCMVKGGGAALTREKIVAAQADRFICIADASKNVPVLGAFPLPVEVIPMAVPEIIRRFKTMGAQAVLRTVNGQPLVTDNGQHLLDVKGLHISDALSFENAVSQWPGVVTVGVFAHQRAQVCLLGTPQGVQTLVY